MTKKNSANGLTPEQEAFIAEYERKVEAFQTLFDDAKQLYLQDGDLDSYKQSLQTLAIECKV